MKALLTLAAGIPGVRSAMLAAWPESLDKRKLSDSGHPLGGIDRRRCSRSTVAALVIVCLLLVVSVALPRSAKAYATNLHIAAFVQVFANGTSAEVRCPDSLDE
jgi:hypothetical protein